MRKEEKALKEGITQLIESLETQLNAFRVEVKEQQIAVLLLEELYVALKDSLQKDEPMPKCSAVVRRRLGEVVVRFSYDGPKRNLISTERFAEIDRDDVNSTVLYSYRNQLSYSFGRGQNNISILVHKSAQKSIATILTAIVAGIFTGLTLQTCAPESLCTLLNENIFTLVYEGFLHALRMMVAPLILFSIISSISNMSDISTLGRLGAKLMSSYLMTTTIACLLGLGFGWIVKDYVTPVEMSGTIDVNVNTVTPTFKGIVMGMIPQDIVGPILRGDMLQLMFIAVFAGTCMGLMRKSMTLVRDFVEQLNALSVKMISVLMKLMPLVAFCAMASTFTTTGLDVLRSCFFIVLCTIVGLGVLICVYAVIVCLIGRLSPLPFLRNIGQVMVVPFTTSSSAASLPNTMNVCTRLGASKHISSFTLPIGATMNMDGCAFSVPAVACVLSAVAGLSLDPQQLPELIITTILIITAIPGLPGGFIVLAGMIMELMGVPMAYLSLVIAINPIIDPILTTTNVTGDMAVTIMLAGNENDIDRKRYNS